MHVMLRQADTDGGRPSIRKRCWAIQWSKARASSSKSWSIEWQVLSHGFRKVDDKCHFRPGVVVL